MVPFVYLTELNEYTGQIYDGSLYSSCTVTPTDSKQMLKVVRWTTRNGLD